ncbi:MAG: hypothetical protein V2A66_01780 [Pseudomonadota bacterium]
MTTTITEGDLQILFPTGVSARKFDDDHHGLAHCMKAVDFIVELNDRYLFIEFKDPQHPNGRQKDRDKFIQEFLAGKIDEDFKYKYRDSFLYEWALERANKPIYYYVLVAMDTLTDADLMARTDDLKRKLPLEGPPSGAWKRRVVAGCAVFNMATWNKHLSSYPVSRMSL